MKAKVTLLILSVCFMLTAFSPDVNAQCNAVVAIETKESRCKSTGEITALVSGGSGNYNYKVINGAFTTITSTNSISGLQAGTYTVEVKDLVSGCIYIQSNVVITGDYQDPRFQLSINDVSCINGNDGALTVINQQYGRGPFTYTIVAPSTAGVGLTNTSGVFSNLAAGDYYVRLSDSCGGLQTRAVSVANYNWWLDAQTITKVGCDQATATVTLMDSKGNSNLSGTTFNGFMYGVARTPGDTSWYASRTFTFTKATLRTFDIVVKDLCGNIKKYTWVETQKPAVAASVTLSNQVCASFRATVTGQANLTSPQYCLFNSSNVQVACNTTGIFDISTYGSYCISVTDICYDTTIQRCFTIAQPVPAVAASVTTSALACSTFTATITGQTNLTTPNYCLYTSTNTLVSCNNTGVFTDVPYGSYCIVVTDACNGTQITRCFTRAKPLPTINPTITIGNTPCAGFSATVTGQQYLVNPQYCIYDNNGVLIQCNTTGIFNGIPYGNYCIRVTNDPLCYDTTIVRCFTVTRPVPGVAAAVTINTQTCTDFRATITGQANLSSPNYCLYNSSNDLIGCNTTGQFNNLVYGSYCIRITNSAACYDTTIERCFTVARPVPAVAAAVTLSNRACTTFSATVTGQANLTSPTYYLYDNLNNVVTSNTTGVFNNIGYGSYCIRAVNTCYDTTIVRCFTGSPVPMGLNVVAAASCTMGTTDFNATWVATTSPYTIQVYNPVGVLVRTVNAASNSASIAGLPALPAGLKYKVVITDQCTNKDSAQVTPNASSLTKSINANSKCPSGQWQNGSGDLTVACQYSHGTVTPKIIKKGATVVSLTHNFVTGTNYTFNSMEPAVYVIEYTLQGCATKVYDTFNLQPYTFPNLQQSAVYQCNNASFGVNSVVNGGLAPFSYEIIGSLPTSPSIISTPQNLPSFNLSNGNSYSLVRLRSIDACGNATINDASILPLANTLINATSNCFYNNITLNVDTIPNATYSWYRKTSAVDSVLITTNQSHNIPYLMPSDTGIYVCKVSINSGCLNRISYFRLTGSCGFSTLSESNFSFKAALREEKSELEWNTGGEFVADQFVVERSNDGRSYQAIGRVKASGSVSGSSQYLFTDNNPTIGNNHYRIKIMNRGVSSLSKVIVLSLKNDGKVSVKPNPVVNTYTVEFAGLASGTYSLRLVNASGIQLSRQDISINAGEIRTMQRPSAAKPGSYYLLIRSEATGFQQVVKLIFQ
ncbi:MAG: hypothetical protein H7Y31_04630 [Chitinophagaceae bacterium]|nr:hypothetical protein [Chitinophagaceae bacterium]